MAGADCQPSGQTHEALKDTRVSSAAGTGKGERGGGGQREGGKEPEGGGAPRRRRKGGWSVREGNGGGGGRKGGWEGEGKRGRHACHGVCVRIGSVSGHAAVERDGLLFCKEASNVPQPFQRLSPTLAPPCAPHRTLSMFFAILFVPLPGGVARPGCCCVAVHHGQTARGTRRVCSTAGVSPLISLNARGFPVITNHRHTVGIA